MGAMLGGCKPWSSCIFDVYADKRMTAVGLIMGFIFGIFPSAAGGWFAHENYC